MASAVKHRRSVDLRSPAAGTTGTVHRVYERPVGAAFTGLLAVIAGAWGALAGYIGPYFGFRPVASSTWATNLDNGLLHLLPGAVAAAAGLMLLAMGPARRSVRGMAFTLPALMLLAAGAWFVIGPVAWPVFQHGNPFVSGVSPLRNLLNVAGASYAPGLVMVMLGGMALKAAAVPRVAVDDPYVPVEAGTAPRRAAMAGTGLAGAGAGAMAERESEATAERRADRTTNMPVAQTGMPERGMTAEERVDPNATWTNQEEGGPSRV